MALPTQIQQQLDAAESLLQRSNALVETPAPEPVETAPAAPVTTSVETPPAKPAVDEFRQKYLSLQGVHRSFEDKIRNLEREKAQIASQLEAAQRTPDQPTPANPQDAETFGSDLVEMVQRVAETMFGTAAKNIDARLGAIEQRLEGTVQHVTKTSEESFYERLAVAVPDYATINTDDGFLAWLGDEDGISGTPRQNALTTAGEALDVGRVAKVFLAYKATLALVEVSAAKPSAAAQLAKQVSPSSAASPAPRNPAKNTFTVAEVQSFYRDVQSGKYRGREAEATSLEASINLALSEGRIVERTARHTP